MSEKPTLIDLNDMGHYHEKIKEYIDSKGSGSGATVLTKAEYDAIPGTESDNKLYLLSDVDAPATVIDTELSDTSTNPVQNRVITAALKNMILDTLYPIGSIYLETTNTNPKTRLGGNWESYGSSDSYLRLGGSGNGGSNTYTLTSDNIPAHTHKFTPAGSVSSHNHGYTPSGSVSSHSHLVNGSTGGISTNHYHSGSTSNPSNSHVHGGSTGGASHSFLWNCGTGHSEGQIQINSWESGGNFALGGHYHDFTTGGVSDWHTHSFSTGNVSSDHSHSMHFDSGSATPSFTGSWGATENSTPSFTGSEGTTSVYGAEEVTEISITPKYVQVYAWKRIA